MPPLMTAISESMLPVYKYALAASIDRREHRGSGWNE